MTRAISEVGRTRSPISVFTESTQSAHDLSRRAADALIDLPFSSNLVPDTRELVGHLLVYSTTSLKRLCDLSIDPYQIHGRRTEKSPFLNARKAPKRPLRSSTSG